MTFFFQHHNRGPLGNLLGPGAGGVVGAAIAAKSVNPVSNIES